MVLNGIRVNYKFWLETEDGYVFGEGPFELLSKIRELGTLSSAAQALGMSYRHAWGVIKNVETRLGVPILVTHKGGAKGGGGAELTKEGQALEDEYSRLKEAYSQASRILAAEGTDKVWGKEGHITGNVVGLIEGRPSTMEVELQKGRVVEFFVLDEMVKRKRIGLGDRMRFELKGVSLQVEKE